MLRRPQSTALIIGLTLATLCWVGVSPAQASFHLMQIERVVGGINGDVTAQAIQLRMRFEDEDLVSGGRLVAYDAFGNNPVVLIAFPHDMANAAEGARILVVSPNFGNHASPPMQADFVMTNTIPPSYLAAGRICWEANFGGVLWSFAYGGSAYHGPTDGLTFNDDDGEFGPAFPGPLPTASMQAVRFLGVPNDPSVSNLTDYALTTGPAVLTNNAGASFTITGGTLPCAADADGNTLIEPADIAVFVNRWFSSLTLGSLGGDFDHNGTVEPADIAAFVGAWLSALSGNCPP